MFNVMKVRAKSEDQDMGFFARLKLGGLALDAMQWASDIVRSIEPAAALAIIMKMVELERDMRGTPGQIKLNVLIEWIRSKYPGGNIAVVTGYVGSLVALLNALGVFRK